MSSAPMKLILKAVVSAISLFYGFVPAFADLNETHLFNPLWSEHARFHGAWFLAFAAGVSLVALFLIWRRDDVLIPIVLGLMFAGGFWVATVFGPAYGGALVDANGYTQEIFGIESNTFLFSIVSILLIATLVISQWIERTGSSHGR
ncbi:MAG: DUF6640 family protein [Pseudomonadota bacterium]